MGQVIIDKGVDNVHFQVGQNYGSTVTSILWIPRAIHKKISLTIGVNKRPWLYVTHILPSVWWDLLILHLRWMRKQGTSKKNRSRMEKSHSYHCDF